jgi:hypothetical protein
MAATATVVPTPTIIDLKALAERIAELDGVLSANAWTRVPGRERIYVDLTKHNGGRSWNGGVGHRLIVHADGRVEFDGRFQWAGAATRKHHEAIGTVEAIEEIAAQLVR